MKTPHLDKLRADIAADPKAKAFWEDAGRRMRPTFLKAAAWHDALFPPESPTSKRRGGNKLTPSPELVDAVCAILDAKMGYEYDLAQSDFDRAMKNGDVAFFRMMAEAAQYVRDIPLARKTWAKHVVAARRIAADMMGESGPLPRWSTVKDAILKQLGQEAYLEPSRDWGRVRKAAGLIDLPD
jgi:hypothetical protein